MTLRARPNAPLLLVPAAALLLLAGCQTGEDRSGGVRAVAASPDVSARTMAILGRLEGQWRLVQEDGSLSETVSAFHVSSGGSVVREVMMVGMPHEMTNLYHMDGDSVVCTHYCAVGNQPRMVAAGLSEEDGRHSLDFRLDSVSNLLDTHDHYMGGLKLTLVDADTVHQEWTSFDAAGEAASTVTFVLKRDSES